MISHVVFLAFQEQQKTEEVQKKPENPSQKEVKEQGENKENDIKTPEKLEPIKEKQILPKISAEEPVDLLVIFPFLCSNFNETERNHCGKQYHPQGLNEENPKAVELDQSNMLALAIVQPGHFLYFI